MEGGRKRAGVEEKWRKGEKWKWGGDEVGGCIEESRVETVKWLWRWIIVE